jgi:hypothetical protein
MATHNLEACDTLLFSQTATWAIKTLHGREAADSESHSKAMEWVTKFSMHSEELKPTEDEFKAAIAEAQVLKTKETLFRYRSWDSPERPKPNDMGPPADNSASAGRYNIKGKAAFYLCSSEEGCHRERTSVKNDKRAYYIQTFSIDFNDLNIADTTSLSPTNLVNHVFLFAERCKSTEGYPDNYLFCQHIASIVADMGFDGMKVFGVRSNGSQYMNVVIFNPNNRNWVDWLQGEPDGPHFIGDSEGVS